MPSHHPDLSLETQIVHDDPADRSASRDLVPPIHMTSAFEFKSAAHGAALFSGQEDGYVYTRIANPTVARMERV